MRYVIIVAGGHGVRMGAGLPKQFLEIRGKAILQHTMEKFLALDRHTHFFVVLPKEYYEYWQNYCVSKGFSVRQTIVIGGISRFHSVQNAIEKISAHHSKSLTRHSERSEESHTSNTPRQFSNAPRHSEGSAATEESRVLTRPSDTDALRHSERSEESRVLVAIHDGVRPLASTNLLQRCFETVGEESPIIGAVPVHKVVDSLCRLDATTLEPFPPHSTPTLHHPSNTPCQPSNAIRHSEGSIATEESNALTRPSDTDAPRHSEGSAATEESHAPLRHSDAEPPRHSDAEPAGRSEESSVCLRHSDAAGEESNIIVPRENLFAVQTPQIFRLDVLQAAYKLPYSETFTDDASVVRAWLSTMANNGNDTTAPCGTIKYIPGERTNIKITTPEDLKIAQVLL